jgi:hypothetical protein
MCVHRPGQHSDARPLAPQALPSVEGSHSHHLDTFMALHKEGRVCKAKATAMV